MRKSIDADTMVTTTPQERPGHTGRIARNVFVTMESSPASPSSAMTRPLEDVNLLAPHPNPAVLFVPVREEIKFNKSLLANTCRNYDDDVSCQNVWCFKCK
jgi:hypothetical protein